MRCLIQSTYYSFQKHFVLHIVFLTALLVCNPAVAQPPSPVLCDQQETGERIKCKFGNIMDQQKTATDMLGDMPSIPDKQKKAMANLADRSNRAKNRMHPNDFKQLTKKSNPQCQVAEILNDGNGDDDGICRGNEDCLEVLNDGIGNDDNICETKGKPSDREVCVQICDNEAISSNPDNYDDPTQDSLGRDLEEQLDETTSQYVELNTSLETQSKQQAQFSALVAANDPCAAVFEQRPTFVAGLIASQAAVTARGVAGQFGTVCDLDVAGFNATPACLVTETIAAIAEIIDDSIDFVDSSIDSDTIDANYACVKELNAKAGETNDALNDILNQLVTVQQQIGVVQEQINLVNQQLQTPQGQRDGWNK